MDVMLPKVRIAKPVSGMVLRQASCWVFFPIGLPGKSKS